MSFRQGALVLLGGAVASCYYQATPYPNVIVRETSNAKYEIQLRKHIEGRGNIHTLSLSKFEYDDSDWLYLDRISGSVEADSLIFTRYWACLDDPWITKDLKGKVDFMDGRLTIALEAPWYDDGKTMSGYRPLDINGTYAVTFEKTSHKPADTDTHGAPCDRKWATNER